MTQTADKALLPAGLKDVLPPTAAYEADTVERLIAAFGARGYQRVKPPLIEFEDALLAGPGAALAPQTFRLMDPVSQRMLGVRADMTTQVARIATSRLARAPRPLRLCYGGQVLRVKGTQMRPERQFTQVGAELLGADGAAADGEVAIMAVEALQGVGVPRLSLDLNLPTLVGAVAGELGLPGGTAAELQEALDRKDAAAVDDLAGEQAPLFRGLLRAAGPADAALQRLRALALPKAVTEEVDRLETVVRRVQAALPELTLTVDPVEHRGFEYQTGISFALYARGVHGELGRGGRYTAEGANGHDERATGFTLFMDTVMRAVPQPSPVARIYLPYGTDHATARALQAEGWVTVQGLEPEPDAAAAARRLDCGHLLRGGRAEALTSAAAASDNPTED